MQNKNAVKAGWTGNNPLSNLGLFGMGFNIFGIAVHDHVVIGRKGHASFRNLGLL